jgi:hypothetical protein
MDALEQIIDQAVSGKINRGDADAFCSAAGIDICQLYNDIALAVAKRFDAGTMSYEDGDGVMNAILGQMADDAAKGHPNPFVEPAWSVYLAFDDGEYVHRNCEDPVETYTRPAIRALVKNAQQIVELERG